MGSHPAKHLHVEELLHDFPGKEVALHYSATKQLYVVLLIARLSTSIFAVLTYATICKF